MSGKLRTPTFVILPLLRKISVTAEKPTLIEEYHTQADGKTLQNSRRGVGGVEGND